MITTVNRVKRIKQISVERPLEINAEKYSSVARAYESFGKSKWLSFGGWINAVIPILIVPYYSVIGGWVIKYLAEYLLGHGQGVEHLSHSGYHRHP